MKVEELNIHEGEGYIGFLCPKLGCGKPIVLSKTLWKFDGRNINPSVRHYCGAHFTISNGELIWEMP